MESDIYRRGLDSLLNVKNTPIEQIIAARGRLIVALNRDLRRASDQTIKDNLQMQIRNEIFLHKSALDYRISIGKHNNQSFGAQVTSEVRFKAQRLMDSIREFRMSDNSAERVANGAKIVGDTVSTAFSVAKVPVVATLSLTGRLTPILGSIVVQPLQIPGFLFSKLINPDGRYNTQTVTGIGRGIGNIIAGGLNLTADAIRRI